MQAIGLEPPLVRTISILPDAITGPVNNNLALVEVIMHTFDLSPLFRSSVGFDRLSQMLDTAFKTDERTLSYPPYNIIKAGEDEYRIVMAVAGFRQEDLTIVLQQNTLTISGTRVDNEQERSGNYLHKGIATRNFERKFSLADHVKVVDAQLADGLLTLALKREIPEASKPRTITINTTTDQLGMNRKEASKQAA